MRICIVGAGPAGLYASILIKRVRPEAQVEVYEQGPGDATWGFGVVFSRRALDFLEGVDPQTAKMVEAEMEVWDNITISHRKEIIRIDGIGFSAIGRLKLLLMLQEQARNAGVHPLYNSRVEDLSMFDDADLVIGADGLNSVIRAEAPEAYGEQVHLLNNRFVWYGTEKPFETLTQTFKETEYGFFNAHHYRYAPDRSTFLIECDAAAFERAGFDGMSEPEYRAICGELFAEELDGHGLINNNSIWRRFPVLVNRQWFHGNRVLVGDALHTAHYSIGSGTRLALEDVIALVEALERHAFDVKSAFPEYQGSREPILSKLTSAALNSANWYEDFGEHMSLQPWPFALSYIMRSGRLDADVLAKTCPAFYQGLVRRGITLEPARD